MSACARVCVLVCPCVLPGQNVASSPDESFLQLRTFLLRRHAFLVK